MCNYRLKYKCNVPENGGKIHGPRGWSLCDVKRPVSTSCKSAHSKPDIISSQLCALCSQFLAMRECKIIVHGKCQRNFKISVKCTDSECLYNLYLRFQILRSTVKFNKWRKWTTFNTNHTDMQHGLASILFHVRWWTVSIDTLVAYIWPTAKPE